MTSAEARRARSFLDRFVAAFPGVYRRVTGKLVSLPPSRIRNGIIAWGHRRVFAAWNRRDWELNTLALDPAEYVLSFGDPNPQATGLREAYEGIDGYLEAQRDMLEAFPDVEVEPEHVGQAGPARFVSMLRFRGRGAASGVPVDQRALGLIEFENGRVVRHWYWWDTEAGLMSLGIEPPRR
jgi:ketosteroid isomerase-like protein